MLMIKSFSASSHRNAFQNLLSTLAAELRQKKMNAIEKSCIHHPVASYYQEGENVLEIVVEALAEMIAQTKVFT